MYNKNYLAKRPFLIITTKFLPAQGARTEQKGWADKYGWNVSEEISIVDRVTKRHLTYATLIVDILEAKVITNGFAGATREEAMQHYLTKYKAQITEAIGVWMESEAHKKAAEMRLAQLNAEVAPEAATEAVAEAVEAPAAE